MAVRFPSGLIRILLRLTLRPFLGPPFPVWFQRGWLRLTSNVNAPSKAAEMVRLEIDGMAAVRACPLGSDPERAVLYLHGGGYCVGSWGSHKGPILNHNNADGVFCGAVDPDDPEFHLDQAVTITGRAGSMSIHHARTLHGSAPNVSDKARLMLFYECCAADAWPLMGGSAYLQRLPQAEQWQDLLDRVVIGEPVLQPRLEQVPVRLPLPPAPDVSSIFQLQKSGGAKSAFAR